MNVRDELHEAMARGVEFRLDGPNNVVISGECTPRFIEWARRHKPEIIAELRTGRGSWGVIGIVTGWVPS